MPEYYLSHSRSSFDEEDPRIVTLGKNSANSINARERKRAKSVVPKMRATKKVEKPKTKAEKTYNLLYKTEASSNGASKVNE